MKRMGFVCLFWLSVNTLHAQHNSSGFLLSYHDVLATRDMSVGYSIPIGSQWASVSMLRVHLNAASHDNQNNVFLNRYRAKTPFEHLGLTHELRRYFSLPWPGSRLFLLENTQVIRMGLRRERQVCQTGGSGSEVLCFSEFAETPPFLTIDNSIGAGIQVHCTSRLALDLRAGAGLAVMAGTRGVFSSRKVETSFSRMAGFGLFYSLTPLEMR